MNSVSAWGSQKALPRTRPRKIRDLLKIDMLDPRWTLPSQLDNHPYLWLISVNGFIIDVRNAPREIQELAYQKGLIPYIPADRKK
jgi:hypothetical protein